MAVSNACSSPLSRRGFLGGAAALGAAGVLSACSVGGGNSSASDASGARSGSKTKGFKIAVEDGYTGNTWRTQTNTNMQQVADELQKSGVISKFTLLTSPNDANTQLTHIQAMIADKPDAILFAPVTNASAQTAVQRMKAAGIPAYVIVDPAPTRDAINVVGGDDTWWSIQAEWLAQQLNGKGKILMVTGLPGNGSDTVRQASVKKVLAKYPGIEVVASVPGNWDPGVARTAVAPVLSSHPQIDAILTQDIMATGIIQAFRAASRPLPKIMTGDYTAAFLRMWKTDLPDLQSIGVPYTPTVGSDALKIVIQTLQGKKFKDGLLENNEINPSITHNSLLMPPALAVTRDGKPGTWKPSTMNVMSLDDAVKQVEGKPDTYALEAPITEDAINGLFQ
jgi:ribose transport system substrate-binding protein